MQVFNAYFKIVKKQLPAIMIYVILFLVIAVIITSFFASSSPTAVFTPTKSKVVVYNEDNTAFSNAFEAYIAKNSTIVTVADNKQDIQDALFYEQADYFLRIPKGFSDSFLSGKNGVQLEETTGSGYSNSSIATGFMIHRFLNMANLYVANGSGMQPQQIIKSVENDLKNSASLEMKGYEKPSATNNLAYYFRILAYSMLAIMVMGITTFMMAFNERDIKNRMNCSPLKPVRMNMQIVLGNITFAVAVWIILIASVFLLYGNVKLTTGILLLCANALVFSFVGLSLGFFVGKFVKGNGAQAAITNVISLGLSFLSGVFVEQSLLGKTVLQIASFNPVYWYVKAVDDIQSTVSFTAQTVSPILLSMLIQLGFAAAFIVIALAVTKQRRTASV